MFMLSLLQLFFGGDLRWAAGVLRHAGKDATKEQRHEAPSLGRSGRWTNWVPSECHRRRKCWWWLWLTLYHDLRYLWNSADYVLSRVKWIWIISVEWWSSWSSTDVSWSNLKQFEPYSFWPPEFRSFRPATRTTPHCVQWTSWRLAMVIWDNGGLQV